MNNILDIDLIINRKKYSRIYNFSFILLTILLITIYVITTYKYQTYYYLKGKMYHHEIEISIPIDEIKYLINNNYLLIDNTKYYYKITHISEEMYIDNNYQNYCYIYLKVNNIDNLDNFIYEIKIPKENKALVKYLKDYI